MLAEVTSDRKRSGWRAKLSLEFSHRHDRTILSGREHMGPLCIQQPFYPADGVCHVYLLHPPGGLAAGDSIEFDARVKSGANALITTPASTKFYRSDNDVSLPTDTILFGGSRAKIDTKIRLNVGASFIGWEALALGRPKSGDHYNSGMLNQRTEIFLDSEAVLLERLAWDAGDPVLSADWGLAGDTVWGAVYAYPADDNVVASIRDNFAVQANVRVGVTLLGHLMVARLICDSAQSLRFALEASWKTLRESVMGHEPTPPRIWMT